MLNIQQTVDFDASSSITSYIPSQLKMHENDTSSSHENSRCDTLFSLTSDFYQLASNEVRDYNRFLSNSYSRNVFGYDCVDFLCKEDLVISDPRFNYRTIQRSLSIIPYCVTQDLLCLSICLNHQDIEDSSIFSRRYYCSLPISHLLRAPFCIAGSVIQSGLCLIPCISSNALNYVTSGRNSWLRDFSSSSLLYFSNGLIKKSQVKSDRSEQSDDEIAGDLFKQIFFQFDSTNANQRTNSEEIYLIKNFLDSPMSYLDDITLNQSHFVIYNELNRNVLDTLLRNLNSSTQFGSINSTNKFFYIFAYNCMLYNYLKAVEMVNRSSLPDDDKMSKIYLLHLNNIKNLKNFIIERFCLNQNKGNYKESISISQDDNKDDIEKTDQSSAKITRKKEVCAFDKYKALLEEFFVICENYLGKLDAKSCSSEIALAHEIDESGNMIILGYQLAKEKYDKDKLASRDSSLSIQQASNKSIEPFIKVDFGFLDQSSSCSQLISPANHIEKSDSASTTLIQSSQHLRIDGTALNLNPQSVARPGLQEPLSNFRI